MSTSCSISLKKNDQFKSIYCHNDGYLDGVGKMLVNNYKTDSDIEKLLALGDLSSLGRLPIDKSFLWNIDANPEDWLKLSDKYCRSYRSRGDTRVDATINSTLEKVADNYPHCSYHYVFDNGNWYYMTYNNDKLKLLSKNKVEEGINMEKFTITYEALDDESTGRFRSIIVRAENEQKAKEKLLSKRPNIEIIGVKRTEDVDTRKGMPELKEAVDNKELLAHQQKVAVAKTTEEEQVPVFADATRNFEKTAKVKEETVKVQQEPKHEEKGKMPKMVPGAKKMMLDEALFEDWDDEDYDWDKDEELEESLIDKDISDVVLIVYENEDTEVNEYYNQFDADEIILELEDMDLDDPFSEGIIGYARLTRDPNTDKLVIADTHCYYDSETFRNKVESEAARYADNNIEEDLIETKEESLWDRVKKALN